MFKKDLRAQRIEELKARAMTRIPAQIKDGLSLQQYIDQERSALNLKALEILLGCTAVPSKDETSFKLVFNQKLPTLDQIKEVAKIFDEFVEVVEFPVYGDLKTTLGITNENGEDPNASKLVQIDQVPKVEKINKKSIYNFITAVRVLSLSGSDIMAIAVEGEKIKKWSNGRKMIIVGLSAVAVIAVAAGVYMILTKDDDGECDCDVVDVPAEDPDVNDVPTIEDDDVPQVEMDD